MFQNRRLFAADESSEVGALCKCTGGSHYLDFQVFKVYSRVYSWHMKNVRSRSNFKGFPLGDIFFPAYMNPGVSFQNLDPVGTSRSHSARFASLFHVYLALSMPPC